MCGPDGGTGSNLREKRGHRGVMGTVRSHFAATLEKTRAQYHIITRFSHLHVIFFLLQRDAEPHFYLVWQYFT